jgi:hypothetical protein
VLEETFCTVKCWEKYVEGVSVVIEDRIFAETNVIILVAVEQWTKSWIVNWCSRGLSQCVSR